MRRPELAGLILDAVRRGGAAGRSLAEILREVSPNYWGQDGRIPYDTDAAFVGDALIALVSSNLIEIRSSSDKTFSKKIKSFIGSSRYPDGYGLSHLLREQGEENIFISITPTLPALQRLLGISITDMIEAVEGGTIKVKPFFGKPDENLSLKSDVFVLMPFKEELHPVYEDHIKTVCQAIGLSCRRADDFFRVGQIMHDIWSAIFLSNWIIADCTGRNPNVFYEMGIAHTLGKQVIIITQSENDVPFDIRYIRFFKYELTPRGMKKFESDLKSALTSTI
jgi:hypothetical protein